MESWKTVALIYFLALEVCVGAPDWGRGKVAQHVSLRVSQAVSSFDKSDDFEDIKKYLLDKPYQNFLEVRPYQSVLKWGEITLLRTGADIAIKDESLIERLRSWFMNSKWERPLEDGPVGLAPSSFFVFPDDGQNGLVWIFDIRPTLFVQMGHACGEGFVQPWPNGKVTKFYGEHRPLAAELEKLEKELAESN